MLCGFAKFLAESDILIETRIREETKEVINRLPKTFQNLLKGYKFKFYRNCTLFGSKDNIGMVHLNNEKKKEIHVAAPWNYSRSFALLHEIAHIIFEKYVLDNKELKNNWQKIVDNTKNKLNQSAEELWCHNFANYFSTHKVVFHTHPQWEKYMKEFVKSHS